MMQNRRLARAFGGGCRYPMVQRVADSFLRVLGTILLIIIRIHPSIMPQCPPGADALASSQPIYELKNQWEDYYPHADPSGDCAYID
jgi:hypothetical protein